MNLTPRETEALEFMAKGIPPKQAHSIMRISINTYRTLVNNAAQKAKQNGMVFARVLVPKPKA